MTSAVACSVWPGRSRRRHWRAIRRSYYDGCRDEIAMLLNEPGWRLTDEEPMVVVWFRVVE